MSTPAERQAERINLGLVEFLARHSVDDDYRDAATRRRSPGSPRRPQFGVAAAVALALFGLLASVAAVQTSRGKVAAAGERSQLVTQVQERKQQVAQLQLDSDNLRLALAARRAQLLRGSAAGERTLAQATRLDLVTGAGPAQGPGLRVVVDDAPGARTTQQRVLDSDLQRLASALFEAGAEAISINGHRLTNVSAIRTAGDAILVDYQPLTRPYVVLAIGDADTLQSRFAETGFGAAWLNLNRNVGLRLDMTPEQRLVLPGAGRVPLTYASPAPSKGSS